MVAPSTACVNLCVCVCALRMSDTGSSVTLILYSIDPKWWTGTEPLLNLIAAAAQRSSFTHVELAIGEVLKATRNLAPYTTPCLNLSRC